MGKLICLFLTSPVGISLFVAAVFLTHPDIAFVVSMVSQFMYAPWTSNIEVTI